MFALAWIDLSWFWAFFYICFRFCLAPNEVYHYHNLPLTHNISLLSANSNPSSWLFNADKPLDSKCSLQHFGQSTLQMNHESVWTPDQAYDSPPDEWSMRQVLRFSDSRREAFLERSIERQSQGHVLAMSLLQKNRDSSNSAAMRTTWFLHVWFLGYDLSRRAAEPTGEKEHSPCQVHMKEHHWAVALGTCLSSTCYWLCTDLHRKLWHEGARIYDPETFSRSRLQNCFQIMESSWTVINHTHNAHTHTQVSRVMF